MATTRLETNELPEPGSRAGQAGKEPVPHTQVHNSLRHVLEHVQDVVIIVLMVLLVGLALQALWRLCLMAFREGAAPAEVLSQVVFILVLTEVYRTLIFYLREHRVSVALMLEVAIVSSLQHLILQESHEFDWRRTAASGLLLVVLGGLLALERWHPRSGGHRADMSAH